MSYKKDEVPKYEMIEQFLMDDLGVFKRADIYKKCTNMIYNLRKNTQLENIQTMQPKLNQIRLEMLKEISKFSRMDTQNTMNKIIDVVYMDAKLKKQIFKK